MSRYLRFNEYSLNEATITDPKYKSGAEVILSDNNTVKKIIKKKYGFDYKPGDRFVKLDITDITAEPDIVLGKSRKSTHSEIMLKDPTGKVFKLIGGISDINGMFKLTSGSKSAGGLEFEDFLTADLINYSNGLDYSTLRFPEIIRRLEDLTHMTSDTLTKVKHNHNPVRRPINFKSNGQTYFLSPKLSDQGKALSDITIYVNGKPVYLSLKKSKSYRIINAGVANIMADDNSRRDFLSSLGIDYNTFEESFDIIPGDNAKDFKIKDDSFVEKHIESIINSAYGSNYIMIHAISDKNVIVESMPDSHIISISNLRHTHRNKQKNKYFVLNFDLIIDGHSYNGSIRLRNNSGKLAPNVMFGFISL